MGDFLVYSLGSVHLNPEYYPEPEKYDPGRWLRPDPPPDAVYTFLGWGAGRHPCTGMRQAKLEIKLITVMFLTGYEFDLVDKDGKFPDPLPVRNRNDVQQARSGFCRTAPCTNTHHIFSLCLDSSPWTHVLLGLQEGCALGRWLYCIFEFPLQRSSYPPNPL